MTSSKIAPTQKELNTLTKEQKIIYYSRELVSDVQKRNRFNACKNLTIKKCLGV